MDRDTKGRFISGHQYGRPPGAKGKTTIEAKEIFNDIMAGQVAAIRQALNSLKKENTYQYLTILCKLLVFFWGQKMDLVVNNPYQEIDDLLKNLSYEKLYELKYGHKPPPDDDDDPESCRHTDRSCKN